MIIEPNRTKKLFINAALTGIVPKKKDNPSVPVTPDEIARDARDVRAAGAAIVHIHARDTHEDPTPAQEAFLEIISRIKDQASDLLICVTTSGRREADPKKRSQALELEEPLKPDLASLTLGSMNFISEASVNSPQTIQYLASAMAERGIKPELEVFEPGMIHYAKYLLQKGILEEPLYFNLFLGSLGTSPASLMDLACMINALPEGSVFAVAGVGRYQFYCNGLSVAAGGHVRVGLEDSMFMDENKSVPATNISLVERIVRLARSLDREIMNPDEVRKLLGIRPRRPAGNVECRGLTPS